MATPGSPANARVLLIDDHEDSREPFAEFLRFAGFDVEEFGTAEDALASIAKDLPAAVVTDITLPGMDGYEAARRLRGDDRTKAIPLVALTGHSLSDAGRNGPLFDGMLRKPVAPEKAVEMVKGLVKAVPR